jgi:hypothetical protein
MHSKYWVTRNELGIERDPSYLIKCIGSLINDDYKVRLTTILWVLIRSQCYVTQLKYWGNWFLVQVISARVPDWKTTVMALGLVVFGLGGLVWFLKYC